MVVLDNQERRLNVLGECFAFACYAVTLRGAFDKRKAVPVYHKGCVVLQALECPVIERNNHMVYCLHPPVREKSFSASPMLTVILDKPLFARRKVS